MLDSMKSGDIIATSVPGRPKSIGHVGIVAPVFGELLIYENTMADRPYCIRTGRAEPKGVQAHHVSEVVEQATRAWLVRLNRGLYIDEEDRLLAVVEGYLGHGPEYVRDGRKLYGTLLTKIRRQLSPEPYLAAEMVQLALMQVGLFASEEVGAHTPKSLVWELVAKGICRYPVLLD